MPHSSCLYQVVSATQCPAAYLAWKQSRSQPHWEFVGSTEEAGDAEATGQQDQPYCSNHQLVVPSHHFCWVRETCGLNAQKVYGCHQSQGLSNTLLNVTLDLVANSVYRLVLTLKSYRLYITVCLYIVMLCGAIWWKFLIIWLLHLKQTDFIRMYTHLCKIHS